MSGIDSSENTTAGITYRWAIYKSSATVEQIRIDMKEFDIAGPKGGACTNESMTIMGADAVTHKILPDMLCGVLTGQHVYLSVKELGTGDKDSICIKDNDAYCDVALTANMDFELKQDSTTSTCNDKVAFGTNVYCGTAFDTDNMATWNYTG